MATEREVTLKLGTKLQGGGDEALKRIGRAAADARQPVDRLFRAANDSVRQLNDNLARTEVSLKRVADSLAGLARQVGALGDLGRRPAALGAGYNVAGKDLRLDPKALATTGRAGASGSLASALWPLLAARGLSAGGEAYLHAFDPEAGYSDTLMRRNLKEQVAGYDPTGFARIHLQAEKMAGEDFEGERRVKEARRVLRETEQRLAIQSQAFDRMRGLAALRTSAQGELLYGLPTQGRLAGVQRGLSAATEAGQYQAFVNPLYNRGEQQQDVARRLASEAALEAVRVQGGERFGRLGLEREASTRQESALRLRLAEQERALAMARANLSAAQSAGGGGGERERALRGAAGGIFGAFGGGGGQTAGERLEERRLQTERALAEVAETRRRLQDEINRGVGLEQQKLEALKQAGEQRVSILKQQRDALTVGIQGERSRLQGLQEHLGLALPREQATVRRVAQKIGAGGQLTFGELNFARQHGDVFGNYLQDVGRQRGAGLMAELMKIPQLKLGAREQELQQQRVEIDNRIKVEVEANMKDLSEQVRDKLDPQLQAMAQQIVQAYQAALQRFALQARNGWRAMFGAPGG